MLATHAHFPQHLRSTPRPRFPPRGTVGFGQPVPLGDIAWKLKWPFMFSNILGMWMLICVVVIGGLEIASLAISTDKGYGNTATIGTGLWCGLPFLIAVIFILMLST